MWFPTYTVEFPHAEVKLFLKVLKYFIILVLSDHFICKSNLVIAILFIVVVYVLFSFYILFVLLNQNCFEDID